MAPPTHRRTGFSRKAQFSAFAGYIVAAAGALLGALLLVFSFWKPDALGGVRGQAADIAVPAGEGGAIVRSESLSLWDTVTGYFEAGSKNARLEREVKEAHVRLAEAEAVKAENARLKALLGLRDEGVKPVRLCEADRLELVEHPPARLSLGRQGPGRAPGDAGTLPAGG